MRCVILVLRTRDDCDCDTTVTLFNGSLPSSSVFRLACGLLSGAGWHMQATEASAPAARLRWRPMMALHAAAPPARSGGVAAPPALPPHLGPPTDIALFHSCESAGPA